MEELAYYVRLRDIDAFAQTPAENILSGGYVVETLEAVVWALITTETLEQALLKVVNQGKDTDTTGAITGGIAALYYGYDAIPRSWTFDIPKYMSIVRLCKKAELMGL